MDGQENLREIDVTAVACPLSTTNFSGVDIAVLDAFTKTSDRMP